MTSTTANHTVSSKPMRYAITRIGRAADSMRRNAEQLQTEAQGVLKALDEGRTPGYGYSHQTLSEATKYLAELSTALELAGCIAETDGDLAAIEAVVVDPDIAYSVEVL